MKKTSRKQKTRKTKSQKIPAIYDPAKIESKWQKQWASSKTYKTQDDFKKEKYYVLDMFPYPSGEGLHVGHPKGYIATDVISRFQRMNGKSVLHPMGFDAFGLPAENYALKTKTMPDIAVKKNVARFKKQLEIIGLDYDWSREVNTTDPKYYKWTQWIFLQLLKKGLAFESYEPINWCPSCKTGLANEDIEDGRCERCGTEVEKKPMRQWVLKITDYADRLLKDLEAKDENCKAIIDWPESIKTLQKNWIGRSEGVNLKFKVKDLDMSFEMYDSIPQTFMAQTFTVIAPEHKAVYDLVKGTDREKEVMAFVEMIKAKRSQQGFDHMKDMEGIFTGRYIDYGPAKRLLPIWVASYVVADYGSGVVNCSFHDERDYLFAKKYNIPLHPVLFPEDPALRAQVEKQEIFYREPNGKLTEPVEFKGQRWDQARAGIIDFIEKNGWGKRAVQYKLRDWVFSRQRYWGEPIPVIHCEACAFKRFSPDAKLTLSFYDKNTWRAVCDGSKNLETRALNPEDKERYFGDVKVGDVIRFSFKDKQTGKVKEEKLVRIKAVSIYGSLEALFNDKPAIAKLSKKKYKSLTDFRACYEYVPGYAEKIDKNALVAWDFEPVTLPIPIPEKDLPVKLPRVKSYEPTGTGESPLAAIKAWVNVKCPVCKKPAKRETNTMPQWAGSSWYYLRYEDPRNDKKLVDLKKEKYWSPVDLYVGGAEHATRHLIYARFWHKFLYDIGSVSTVEPFKKLQHVGLIMGEDGRKMSKRFGNVVNPDEIVKTLGADSLRVYEMFMGPFDQQISWSTSSIVGPRRFIEKIWRLSDKISIDSDDRAISVLLNKTIKKVSEDIENMRFNTAISSLMIAVNEIEALPAISKKTFESILKLLAPFAPHVAEELWNNLGNKVSIHISAWPRPDQASIQDAESTIIIQVNGKLRGTFMAPINASKEELENAAKNLPEIGKWLNGKEVKKVIVVPQRLVSFVVVDKI